MKVKHFGKVENGKLVLDNKGRFTDDIRSREGKRVFLTVSDNKRDRSSNQNRYYWGVVIQLICEHTGHTPDEVHNIVKTIILPPISKTIESKTYEYSPSTTSLNTTEFENYLEQVREWALRLLGLNIPLPNEVDI